jgi:hypothetical protein
VTTEESWNRNSDADFGTISKGASKQAESFIFFSFSQGSLKV